MGIGLTKIARQSDGQFRAKVFSESSGSIKCLATFPWAKFRKKKGGVKAHVLYDIEAQVPASIL